MRSASTLQGAVADPVVVVRARADGRRVSCAAMMIVDTGAVAPGGASR